jgi:hypothetical protein
MKISDFEALSFDCYGTLIDWESGLSAVLVPWARDRGLTLSGEQLLAEYAALEAAVEAERPEEIYPEVLAESMRRLGTKLRAEVTGEDAARLARSVPDWPAFPDSRPWPPSPRPRSSAGPRPSTRHHAGFFGVSPRSWRPCAGSTLTRLFAAMTR